MSNIAISFEHVSKMYQLGVVGTGTISNDFKRWWAMSVRGKEDPFLKIGQTNDRATKGTSDFVYALRDIDFKVEQGDVVGIIGKNGAGKSTLLKLLSRITAPTSGTIRAKGRVASLLEVGTGFHVELTGRENIYLNGTIMGMTRKEIDAKLDEIVDFAGVERYIDTPVKRYSSGMQVRLGFAVAAFLEPEILVVDEVLAVGDAEFQAKAIGKMQDVSRGDGRTVLFVSHNMASVRSLCKSGILLYNGTVKYSGSANDTIDRYMQMCAPKLDLSLPVSEMVRTEKQTDKIHFTDVKFLNEKDEQIIPHCGQFLKVQLEFDVLTDTCRNSMISFDIINSYGIPVMSFPTNFVCEPLLFERGHKVVSCVIPKLPLSNGKYKISLYAGTDGGKCADYLENAIEMDVAEDDFFNKGKLPASHLAGKIVFCEHTWNI